MRFTVLPLTCLCLILNIIPGFASDTKSGKQMDHMAMMELYHKLAMPGPPHKLFATLAGSWRTNTKSWMEPGKPAMESTGTAEIKMLLDGRFLYQEFNGQMMGQPFSGIGIDGYDNIQKKYVTAWMDSMGTGIFFMEGTASPDGRTINLTGEHIQPDGGVMSHRAVWNLISSDKQKFVMYGTHQGGKEMKAMEIIYTRIH